MPLTEPFDLVAAKTTWLAARADAEVFVRRRPAEEIGCLYYSAEQGTFVMPSPDADGAAARLLTHFGLPGGIVPRIVNGC